jgi:acetolactate synthase-1/3 small subunit
VAEVEHEKHKSRITIVTSGTEMVIEQIKKLLEKMVPVYKVHDLTIEGPHVERELALVKVVGEGKDRMESLRIADVFNARVIDSTSESFVFEITGDPGKIDAFVSLIQQLGLVEVCRTGIAAMNRGKEGI